MSAIIVASVLFGTTAIALLAWAAVAALPLSLAAATCGGAWAAVEHHYGEVDE